MPTRKHGLEGTPEYCAWANMRYRARNPKCRQFKEYGGRGIGICRRWNSFALFYKDMGPKPQGTSLDRRNNNKGYVPRNCRWATPKQQQRNRRCCTWLTARGKTQCLTDWAEEVGLDRVTLRKRLERGMNTDEAIFTPVDKSKSHATKRNT